MARRRRGFTLVELLVVITIIGMLVAILLPAVNSARESARKMLCSNNMRGLAQGVSQFENSKGYYPGYRNPIPARNGSPNPVFAAPWFIAISQYNDRNDLYEDWYNPNPAIAPAPNPRAPFVPQMFCPSADLPNKDQPWTTYAVNCGFYPRLVAGTSGGADPGLLGVDGGDAFNGISDYWWRAQRAENGIFHDRFMNSNLKVSNTDINDGLGTTILLSENVTNILPTGVGGTWNAVNVDTTTPALTLNKITTGIVWLYASENNVSSVALGRPAPTPGCLNNQSLYTDGYTNTGGITGCALLMKINGLAPGLRKENLALTPETARPSGYHRSGVNAAFCDASTRFISDDIDYRVYQQLMTPRGGVNASAGTDSDMPDTSVIAGSE